MVGSSYITWQSERNFDTIAVRGRLTRSRYNRHYGGFQDTLGHSFSFFFFCQKRMKLRVLLQLYVIAPIFYRKIYMNLYGHDLCHFL